MIEKAWDMVEGEYITAISSDDKMMPDKIMWQVDFLESHKGEYDACSTWVECIGNNPDKCQFFMNLFNVCSTPREEMFRKLFFERNYINAGSVMTRTDVFKKLGGFFYAYRQLQDFKLWCELTVEHALYIMPKKLTVYRCVDGSVSDHSPKVTVRDLNEQVNFKYQLLYEMSDEAFSKLFPLGNADMESRLDIMCRKLILMMNNAKYTVLVDITARLYYQYVREDGFEDLLEDRYHITRKDMHEYIGTHTTYQLFNQMK